MTFFHVLILSAVEGVTEFLPISSTGHLVLVAKLFSISQTPFVKSFEIIIQLGAILAVVLLYRKTLLNNLQIWKKILIAFLPTMLVGFTLYKIIKSYLIGNTYVTLAALFLGGITLILLELYFKKKERPANEIVDMTYRQALLVGLCQSVSIVPGVSRAAATIIGGLGIGLSRKAAIEFSFLLAVPTMLAATILDLYKSQSDITSSDYVMLAVGFVSAFLVAIVAIKWFVTLIKSHTLIPFGIYRIALAVIYFLFIPLNN
jgi:undecaprenyl-diphosphatase